MRLILFDLDGTLIDSEQGIVNSIEYSLAKLGVASPGRESLRGWIGPPLRAVFPNVVGDDPDLVERGVTYYRERFSEIGWLEHTVYPGIGDIVDALAANGDRLAVVTSKADLYAERIVRSFAFGARFERVYAAPPGSNSSEKASMIAKALTDAGIEAGDATMIGDRLFDIEGARANRVRAIGAGWGFGSREELVNAGADVIADSVAQLRDVLGLTARAKA